MGNGWETHAREEVITGQFTGKKTLLYQAELGGDAGGYNNMQMKIVLGGQ